MIMDIRDYNEQTFADAKVIVSARFGEGACFQLRRLLNNPLRTFCSSAGDIAYKDGNPMAFQAAILKRLFLRRTELFGVSGAMFCKMPKAPLRCVLAVSDRTCAPRAGSLMTFGNTAMPISTEIALASDSTVGPDSCANIRFSIIRLGGFLNFALHGRLPNFLIRVIDWFWLLGTKVFGGGKRRARIRSIMSLDDVDIDAFWKRYLAGNRGLVSSRTKDELNWIFGDDIKNGNVHFLVLEKDEKMSGYVILKRHAVHSSRWMVVDWIAEGDDRKMLGELLAGANRHLRCETDASFVEIIGYPMFVQDVIGKDFPYRRKAKSNSFSYRIDSEKFRKDFEQVKDVSWFFGAYDGDRCMA